MNSKIRPIKIRNRPTFRHKIRTKHRDNQIRSDSLVPFLETEIGFDDIQEIERHSDEQLFCDINRPEGDLGTSRKGKLGGGLSEYPKLSDGN